MLVYRIIFPNGKNYVGATSKTLEARKKVHIRDAIRGSDYPVHNAIRKYFDDIEWEVLEEVSDLNKLYDVEAKFISKLGSSVLKNGYNVKEAGFHITGTHIKNLSEKLKERLSIPENRIKHAEVRGSKKFKVYDLLEQKFIGSWINQNMAAEELEVTGNAINNVLTGRAKQFGKYTAVYEENIESFPEFLKKFEKPFIVKDLTTGKITKWINKSACQRELGISRATIRNALDGKKMSNKYRYLIEEIVSGD